MSLVLHAQQLVRDLEGYEFSDPVSVTYNPLTYAWNNHRQYLERYGSGKKKVLFLGMNPGPWGMSQTGIPFGEISFVRDWMKLDGKIGKPEIEHPKRKVEGYDCTRSEVSGKRLWGYFAEKFPKAEDFFADHFVLNFCPLVWMSETGANIIPEKLGKEKMKLIEKACAKHLKSVISELEPSLLVGVGAFAEKRLETVKNGTFFENVPVGKILHPSPASPAANRGWAEAAEKQLLDLGVKF